MKWAYYNDNDAYCAQWLRNLIAAGHLPAGDVDERDIRKVSGDDLKGYGQCHFFAGIGGWAYAGRLAGIPDDEPLWTGSCPCQPLSSAGQRKGHADERHLWPAFHALIAECHPATVFGEQVASKLGREWLAGVRADLEHLGYAVGAANLPAAGLGAPHIRQRLWWVADAQGAAAGPGHDLRRRQPDPGPGRGLGDPDGAGPLPGKQTGAGARHRGAAIPAGGPGGAGDTESIRSSGGANSQRSGEACQPERAIRAQPIGSSDLGLWNASDLVPCADGKARRVEPGTFPLADGIPARVGRLRAYGNAIVPQVAAEFMMAARAT